MSEYIVRETDLESTEWISEYEEIVRCRDCKHYEYDVFRFGGCFEETPCCNRDWNGEPVLAEVEPNGFCAWGEKVER